MIYTAYTEEEYNNTPQKYRRKIVGVKCDGEIIQVPLCPICGSEMLEDGSFLSCIDCGESRPKRIIKDN